MQCEKQKKTADRQLLAEVEEDRFEDEQRPGGSDDRQRLTGEGSVQDSADGSRHQSLHRSLYNTTPRRAFASKNFLKIT